ncbi:lipid A biosynthesis acyltransferase [Candidatus Thalassolituus haligoni]|uniref:LpxL/LpxP family acyltransferase n=1 Tax=Candidatus Thalassolituus haligoni TaxID=3100113 RepID=UPI0035144B55
MKQQPPSDPPSNKSQHWSDVTEKGSSLGMILLLWFYRYLGRPAFSVVAFFVIGWFYLSARVQRQAAQDFQQRVAQHRLRLGMPEWQPRSFRQFLAFGFSALDKISAWAGDIHVNDVDFRNFQTMQQAVGSGQGGVILISHHGNMEICRAIGQQIPTLKINAVVHTRNAVKFNQLLQKVAPDAGLNLIEVTSFGPETAVMMLDKIERGEFIVIVADRTSVQYRERSLTADFLGVPAYLPEGPFILASILKCPVYFMACLRGDDNRFLVDFTPYTKRLLLDRKHRQQALANAAQDYAHWLEGLVLQFPTQWFNFFDFWEKPRPSRDKNPSKTP